MPSKLKTKIAYFLINCDLQSRCILQIKVLLKPIVLKTNMLEELFDKILQTSIEIEHGRGHSTKS